MKRLFTTLAEMRAFLLLWFTQMLSGLGSSIMSYGLVIWSYGEKGSALVTALLMVCSYAPYVIFSIFAGALSDRWDKRKTMLACDAFAACMTIAALVLFRSGSLRIWHLYGINALTGLMNTFQQPASEVATTLLLPRKHYQRVGGLAYFANALTSILTPVIATVFMSFRGLEALFLFDILTFLLAFLSLLFIIRIPKPEAKREKKEPLLQSVREGLGFLKKKRGILHLILLFACINLVASMYEAAFPALMIPRKNGEQAMGIVKAVTGGTMLAGSLFASFLKRPKSRIRVIMNSLLLSMGTENLLLAFGRGLPAWCLGAFLGWICIPVMNANLSAVMRLSIPKEIQGRVYAARNSLQFFTIPAGYFLGGFFVDCIFEPLMACQSEGSLLVSLFGAGKGSGSALFFAFLAAAGIAVCLFFRRNRAIWALDEEGKDE